jgi:hypothetical protein
MGFSVHLGKPVNPDELTTLVAKLAQEHTHLCRESVVPIGTSDRR